MGEKFNIVIGDLFELTGNGNFDVIAQGNNCFNRQGAGIAVLFKKHFKTDKFKMELSGEGDKNKLGLIDYEEKTFNGHNITVVNCYTQYNYKQYKGHKPFDFEAFKSCMKKINEEFKGLRIGLPLIGGGLAGGDKDLIISTMKDLLIDCDVTLVLFENKN